MQKITKAEHLQNFNDYLDDVKHFADNYSGIDGFDLVVRDLKLLNKSESYNKSMEAAAFMIRVLKKKPATFLGKVTKFEGSIDDLTNGCRYDLIFTNGTKTTFGEFKSYAASSLSNFLTTGGDTYQQFTTYFGKINSLDELQYYFDLGKVTDINLIKNRFKAVFVANAEDLFSKNVAMFSNIAINPTSKIDTWQKLKAVAQDDALFDNLIGSKIINLE